MEQAVLYTIENGIALITLNRPKRHNAINRALLTGLYNALDDATTNDNVRVVVITGNGKSFCSGIDLDAIKSENLFDPRGDGTDFPDIVNACQKPIIGAVNGNAITGGFEIALNCDFLIASEKASFADTHAKVGIHPGWGMTQLLQESIGVRRAKQMSLTCQFIGADRAAQWGLVNEVVPHEMLMPRTMQLAGEVCTTLPDMQPVVKKLIEFRGSHSLTQSLENERTEFKKFVKEKLKF